MLTNHIRRNTHYYEPTFKQWLKMPLTDIDGVVLDEKDQRVTHEDYLQSFMNIICSIIAVNKYRIIDKKKFKKEIYKFIYTLSDNSNEFNAIR